MIDNPETAVTAQQFEPINPHGQFHIAHQMQITIELLDRMTQRSGRMQDLAHNRHGL
jgi:hypothetical protein